MRIRFFILIQFIFLLLIPYACSESLRISHMPEVIYPGKAERIVISIPSDDTVTIGIYEKDGTSLLALLRDSMSVSAGEFSVTYNGYTERNPLPEGSYLLAVRSSTESVSIPFLIGRPAPQILSVTAVPFCSRDSLTLSVSLNVTCSGTLNPLLIDPDGNAFPLKTMPITEGTNKITLEVIHPGPGGEYTLSLTATDADNISGNSYQVNLSIPAAATPKPQPTIRPSANAASTIPGDYWSMEVGNYDWDAIWQVIISPMTIIKGTGKQAERQTYKLRLSPDSSTAGANVCGLITCETQGIHVLETLDNGWSYVEVFNSSYGEAYRSSGKGTGFGTTDDLVRGYVETSRLDTFMPRTEYGLLIDKLTQELFILTKDGLLSSILVSTGSPSNQQPWNETPSGEFYLSSKVGDFPSGNLICQYGMRFNNGDILHQVPYIYNEKYDLKDYSSCEKYLGQKASHGCVRVQRKANEDGFCMKWIWDHVPLRTKLLIWDDDGRPAPFMEYPFPSDTVLYFNPEGGQYYHTDPNCSSIKNRFLPLKGNLTYADLDLPQYSYLSPCKYCSDGILRISEIDAINTENGYW